MITAEYVRDRLQYDPETGVFLWKARPGNKWWNTNFSGKAAGSMNSYGYRRIMIDKKEYMAARLAWLIVYGEWPKNEIDHINRVKSDDRLVNLRDVTSKENCNNKSNNNGLPEGVHWHTGNAKYKAHIPWSVPIFSYVYLGQYVDPITAGEVVQEGIEIIFDNEDANEETIKRLLKGLKDSRTEILSEAKRKKSGLPKGINKHGNKFQAQIWRNGKNVHLGTFNTLEEAVNEYQRTLNQ
jgi:hypothetical protein